MSKVIYKGGLEKDEKPKKGIQEIKQSMERLGESKRIVDLVKKIGEYHHLHNGITHP